MNRTDALVKARSAKAANRSTALMIRDECRSLRAQVAEELSKARFSSGINVHIGDIDEEYVPDLKTLRSRTRVFERMANDPYVRGQLRAITSTIESSVRFKAIGSSKKRRDLVAANILNQGDKRLWCSSSFRDRLYEMLGCLIYGFALFGKTRAVVDGKTIFSHLSWLHPRSVDEDGWVMDDSDSLIAVRRSYQTPDGQTRTREPIPADDIFLVTWDRRGPNWEGNSFIRPMYRPWLLNEIAEKIDMIDLQNRGVAIPMAKLSGSGSVKERDTLVQMLQDMRGGSKERVFLVVDKDSDIKFLTSEGQAKDAGPTWEHHRSSIVKVGGSEYFEQGNTATGSRAGASALATGFFIQVNAIVKAMVDALNFGVGTMPGLVQELQDMNFDDDDDYAVIEASSVSPTEQLDNVPLMEDAVAKGMIPPNLKHANELARLLNWPELTPAEWDEAMKAKQPAPGLLGPGSPANGGPGRPNEAGPDDEGRDDTEGRRLMMQEKKTFGGPRQTKSPASWPWLKSIAG